MLETGAAVVLKVRAKSGDGEVRFFGDEAEPIAATMERAVSGLRVHVSTQSVEMESLKSRLEPALGPKGGEITLVGQIGGGTEVEIRLEGRYRLDAALRGAL